MRYLGRADRFRQDRMFQNNQRQFYKKLNQEGKRCDDDQPDAEERDILSELVYHDRDAKWLKDLQIEVNVKKRKVDITKESLKKVLGRMPNRKSPDPDLVQGVLIKKV